MSYFDLHTPGTPKIMKMTILLVKKVEKNCFFGDFSVNFDSEVIKIQLEIVLNLSNKLLKAFDPNRPVSAKIQNLAYFSAKFYFAQNVLIFEINIILYLM